MAQDHTITNTFKKIDVGFSWGILFKLTLTKVEGEREWY